MLIFCRNMGAKSWIIHSAPTFLWILFIAGSALMRNGIAKRLDKASR